MLNRSQSNKSIFDWKRPIRHWQEAHVASRNRPLVDCQRESNLLRLFRRHYVITPSEFRERFCETVED